MDKKSLTQLLGAIGKIPSFWFSYYGTLCMRDGGALVTDEVVRANEKAFALANYAKCLKAVPTSNIGEQSLYQLVNGPTLNKWERDAIVCVYLQEAASRTGNSEFGRTASSILGKMPVGLDGFVAAEVAKGSTLAPSELFLEILPQFAQAFMGIALNTPREGITYGTATISGIRPNRAPDVD